MSSQRLPGKVLRAINGKPLLDYLLESASKCEGIAQTIVATSEHQEDDAIEAFSVERNIPCFRGELDNVANRALSLQEHNRLARPLYPKHVRRLRSRIKAGTASSLAARHNPPPTPAPPNGRARGLKQRKPQLQHPL